MAASDQIQRPAPVTGTPIRISTLTDGWNVVLLEDAAGDLREVHLTDADLAQVHDAIHAARGGQVTLTPSARPAARDEIRAAIAELHAELTAQDEAGCSSNDFAQIVDAWFVDLGMPSVLYRHKPKASRRQGGTAA
jgi:hypothetical protein